MPSYKGLTWDHPRGFEALDAAARQARDEGKLQLRWDKQPLEGFEEHPIAELCAAYDLVVLDHPHVGEAVQAGCLTPLERVVGAGAIEAVRARTIGPCLDSYFYAGQHWALPLDAATQVMAYRPDLVEQPPVSWDETLSLAGMKPVVLSLAGPHAALTLFSIALSLDPRLASDGRLFPAGVGEAAFETMQRLYLTSPESARELNPIGILRMMSDTDGLALCPLVYGYVNYAGRDVRLPSHRLAFANAPAARSTGRRGSILGGTGIGVSSRCQVTPELIDHLLWLMDGDTQSRFIPDHAGQPSALVAWRDPWVNAAWGDFYRTTEDTLEQAHVRPRYHGYIAFQKEASKLLRESLAGGLSAGAAITALEARYSAESTQNQER